MKRKMLSLNAALRAARFVSQSGSSYGKSSRLPALLQLVCASPNVLPQATRYTLHDQATANDIESGADLARFRAVYRLCRV